MTKINIITPPDVVHNQSTSFFLIQPSVDVRDQFQNLMAKFEKPFNVYLYDPQTEDDLAYDWVLNISKMVDFVILDVDQCEPIMRNLCSYLISLPNTFYLTNDEQTPYNMLSVNRIFNLDWLYEKLKEE
tara:strand:- start:3250 stop:3636 length:387 start_codon:yes stop_codon:yes gene_type:complete